MKEYKDEKIDAMMQVVLEKEVQALEMEKALAAASKRLQRLVEFKKEIDEDIANLKETIRNSTPDKYSDKRELDGNTLAVSVSTATSVSCEDIDEVDDEFIEEVEIDHIVKRGGKYYQKQFNNQLVQNLIKAGMECPAGCELRKTKRVSVKWNGKPL